MREKLLSEKITLLLCQLVRYLFILWGSLLPNTLTTKLFGQWEVLITQTPPLPRPCNQKLIITIWKSLKLPLPIAALQWLADTDSLPVLLSDATLRNTKDGITWNRAYHIWVRKGGNQGEQTHSNNKHLPNRRSHKIGAWSMAYN